MNIIRKEEHSDNDQDPHFLCLSCINSEMRWFQEPSQSGEPLVYSHRQRKYGNPRKKKWLRFCNQVRFFIDPNFNDRIIVTECKEYQDEN